MKTTVEISDALLSEARAARRERRLKPEPRAAARRRIAFKRELRGVEQELAHYAEPIPRTGPLPPILEALEHTAAVVDDLAVSAELRKLCAEWR